MAVDDRRKKLADLKARTRCVACGKKGHWKGDKMCSMNKQPAAHVACVDLVEAYTGRRHEPHRSQLSPQQEREELLRSLQETAGEFKIFRQLEEEESQAITVHMLAPIKPLRNAQ